MFSLSINRTMGASKESSGSALNGQAVPFNLTELDREVLAQTDEEFRPNDWEDLKKIVGGFCFGSYVLLPMDFNS